MDGLPLETPLSAHGGCDKSSDKLLFMPLVSVALKLDDTCLC